MYLVHVVFGKPHKNFSGRGLFIELVGLSFSWDLNNNRRPNEQTPAGLTWQQHEASPPLYSPFPQPRRPQSKMKNFTFHTYSTLNWPACYLSTMKKRTFTCPSTALWLWSPGWRQFLFPTFNHRDEFVQRRVYKKIHLFYFSENVDLTSSITGSRATTSMLDAPGLLSTIVDFLLLLGVSFT